MVGTTIEWYDFYLYATAAALVLKPLFFPSVSPTAGTLASFATYAAGFGARPVGAVIAGHLGDRVGRKAVLVGALLLMGVATAVIGALPTYSEAGVLEPAALATLRGPQGLAAGAGWGGGVRAGRCPGHNLCPRAAPGQYVARGATQYRHFANIVDL